MLIGERTKRKQGQTAAGLRAVVVNFIFALVLVRTFALLWWFIYTVDSESSSAFISHYIKRHIVLSSSLYSSTLEMGKFWTKNVN